MALIDASGGHWLIEEKEFINLDLSKMDSWHSWRGETRCPKVVPSALYAPVFLRRSVPYLYGDLKDPIALFADMIQSR